MSNVNRVLPFFCVAVLLPVLSPAQGRPPTTAQALAALVSAQGEEFEAARSQLAATESLLSRHGRDLAGILGQHAADPDVLTRVFELTADRGAEGCAFIAGQMGASAPAWTDLVLRGMDRITPCAELDLALVKVLEWTPDPAADPAAEVRVLQVMDLLDAREVPGVAEAACRFVHAGTLGLRERALQLVLGTGDDAGRTCLVQAYQAEAERGATPFRARLLDAIASMGGVDAIPTLIVALERPEDRDAACRHLLAAGERALSLMILAARTAEVPAPGLQACFRETGAAGADMVLPLLDHPQRGVRAFALEHLRRFYSPLSLQELLARFQRPAGRVSRAEALEILAGYPVEVGGDAVEAGLGDADEGIRMLALRLVERHHARHFVPTILRVAEEDPVPEIRVRALAVLTALGADEAVPLAIRMLQYEEPPVAAEAARLLGWLGNAKAFDLLVKWNKKTREAEVREAVQEALWVQSYADPSKRKVKRKVAPKRDRLEKSREVACGGLRAEVVGKKGPLVIVLPGGLAMDHSWSRPYLDRVGKDAVVAFVQPEDGDAAGLIDPTTWGCLFEALGRERATVVSAGLGGTAALWLASRDPSRVAGVVALGAPLPGTTANWDVLGVERLGAPFQELVRQLLANRDRYHPEALGRYLARAAAPAQAEDRREPQEVLRVAVDLDRIDRAAQVLSGPDVALRPTEAGGPVLFLLAADTLDSEGGDAYRALQDAHPGRISVRDIRGCGMQFQVACGRKVVKTIVKFAKSVEGR
jgi:pimeloyl-ACP methyl ester carboxylesterase